ncbi:nuclear transport factor 2 family protein [Elongatibacter sediminis]|uniref:Nuclear transport factor 2 family protein n=1 Tax=Elongatibacter sediminis TaxID=3119006 RepID=A0AAW9R8K3_9GAMM
MTPKQTVRAWIEAFNRAGIDTLADCYAEQAVNHQVTHDPAEDRQATQPKTF